MLRLMGPFGIDGASDAEIRRLRPRGRALVSYLAIRSPQAAGIGELAEALWSGVTDHVAVRHRIYDQVCRVRHVLGGGFPWMRIETSLSGYRLDLSADRLDSRCFCRLAHDAMSAQTAGDLESAVGLWEAATDLWRGPPLDEFRYESWSQSEIRNLEVTRLLALEGRYGAEIALGRHQSAVAALERLVSDHPFHEPFRFLLMKAMWRSGWRLEALRSFDEFAQLIETEHGLRVSPGLAELRATIARG